MYLSPRDLDRMHRWFGIARSIFIERYCRWAPSVDGQRLTLREQPNRDCIFWRDGGCSVYAVRPLQCRAYPFWRHIVDYPDGWEREAAECPGIGIGPAIDPKRVDALMNERESAGHVVRRAGRR